MYKFDLNKYGFSSIDDNFGLFLHVANIGDIKVVRLVNMDQLLSRSKEGSGSLMLGGCWGNSHIQAKMPEQGSPMELILELGVVGISIVDHKPRELAYLYMEKFFISYSTGYDGGTTSRFLISLQLFYCFILFVSYNIFISSNVKFSDRLHHDNFLFLDSAFTF